MQKACCYNGFTSCIIDFHVMTEYDITDTMVTTSKAYIDCTIKITVITMMLTLSVLQFQTINDVYTATVST